MKTTVIIILALALGFVIGLMEWQRCSLRKNIREGRLARVRGWTRWDQLKLLRRRVVFRALGVTSSAVCGTLVSKESWVNHGEYCLSLTRHRHGLDASLAIRMSSGVTGVAVRDTSCDPWDYL
jgi:hypothetical protein